MSEHIEGYVEHIIFRNEENGYTVFETVVNRKEITCTGNFISINEGEYVEMEGSLSFHPSYGEQFKVDFLKTTVPGDARALERYLGSGAIKGIGHALAARIVHRFGEDTLRIIEEEPERLAEVKGISENKAVAIAAQITEKSRIQDAMIFLSGLGISMNLSAKIYAEYGEDTYQLLRENPYKMAEDIPGVGFKTADRIAVRAGISSDSPYRIKSAVVFILNEALGNGNVYLPEEVLEEKAAELLKVDPEYLAECMDELSIAGKIIRKRDENGVPVIYASESYFTELSTAKMLLDLNVGFDSDEKELARILGSMKKDTGIELDTLQKEAVAKAVSNGVFILTGGPGTGKTTAINAIIKYFLAEDMEVKLAAPTGRAARRMEEAAGYEASTIHRLLELFGDPSDDGNRARFQRNKDNPVEADVIIIDEMSMVDIFLMHALLSAITPGTRLIMVGDMDQLPSVGPGRVLADMINSGCFAVVRLDKIFRQAAQSDIIVNAHKIVNDEKIILDNRSKDFFFLEQDDYRVIQKAILTLVSEKMPRYTDSDIKDIQVLSPMRKGVLGVENLNRLLQKYLNPASPEKEEKETASGVFREGDKVMQIRNDYQLSWEMRGLYGIVTASGEGIFNGDMGVIETIRTFDQTLTVVFDDNKFVEYSFSQLDELELAYAVTVHKSQGSEYPAVIMPMLQGPMVLMTRNLVYTALTRAKKCVVLLGSKEFFEAAVANTREEKRYTSLTQMLLSLREI